MGKILPLLLAFLGVAVGIGAGYFLRPDPVLEVEVTSPCGDVGADSESADHSVEEPEPSTLEYVKLNNQFVIPVVEEARVAALVVVSLTVEVTQGRKEEVYFNMSILRKALMETAKDTTGDLVSDVLIMDIARQDV